MFGTYEGEPIVFEPWQGQWLRDHSRYRAVEKAPQIGWSWTCALEALHEAIMFRDSTSGFVSIDLREAGEKILFARKAYSELPEMFKQWVPVVSANKDEFWIGEEERPSRLISFPQSSGIRGKRMSVYLDEADFYKDSGREVFRSAISRIARGGRLSVGSTCFGEDTMLDRICKRNLEEEVPNSADPDMNRLLRSFNISRLPFTVVKDEGILETVLRSMLELTPQEAAEEYGCIRGGGSTDTFTPDLLRTQTWTEELETERFWDPSDGSFSWAPQGDSYSLGYDPAKSIHPAVLTVLEHHPQGWVQTVKWEPRHKGKVMPLPMQQELLHSVLRTYSNGIVTADAGGLGAQMAQALSENWPDRFIPLIVGGNNPDLPPMTKRELVLSLKRGLEDTQCWIGSDRRQFEQFRRTRIGGDGRIVQPGSDKRTHYDDFWTMAYAWYGTRAKDAVTSVYSERGLFVVGGKGDRWDQSVNG